MGPVEDATSKLVKGVDELKAAILDAQSAQIAAETLYSVVELSALQASSLLEDFPRRVVLSVHARQTSTY